VADDLGGVALDYAGRGLAVIPLATGSKTPAFDLLRALRGSDKTAPLAERPLSPDEVRVAWERDPAANVGVLAEPSRVVIADVDHPARVNGELRHPPTPTFATARPSRYALLFRAPEGLPARILKRGWGELMAAGYHVMPPSVVVLDGRPQRYEWIEHLALEDFCEIGRPAFEHLPPLPPNLMALLSPHATETQDTTALEKYTTLEKYFSRVVIGSGVLEHGVGGELDTEPVALALLLRFGVKVSRLGQPFRCPLHPEKHASAALWRLRDGKIALHDFHGRATREWIPLPDLYASLAIGQEVELGPGERACWRLRALVDIGILDLPAVDHAELPTGAPMSARALYGGFVYLLGVRRLYDPVAPAAAPYSWRFAEHWTGLSRAAVRWASGYLIHRNYLTITGQDERGYRLLALGPGRESTGGDHVPDSGDPE